MGRRHIRAGCEKNMEETLSPRQNCLKQQTARAISSLPPHCHGLGTSLELISMPNDVFALCQGKSTYGRCGLIANILPIEPGWAGYLTMCLINPTDFPIRLYANEGIAQLVLFGIEEVGKRTLASTRIKPLGYD
jgi:dCTP deaminase